MNLVFALCIIFGTEFLFRFFNIPKINYCVLFNGSKYIVLNHFKTFSSQLFHAHVCSTHLFLCGILRFRERGKENVSNTHQHDMRSPVKRARCPEQIRGRIYKTDWRLGLQ